MIYIADAFCILTYLVVKKHADNSYLWHRFVDVVLDALIAVLFKKRTMKTGIIVVVHKNNAFLNSWLDICGGVDRQISALRVSPNV